MSAALAGGRYLALLGVGIASFLGCIDFTIVNTAIPALRAELGMSVGDAQWVVTAFVMALTATMVASGRLADLHGRRRALYAGMALFGLGSLGAGLSQGMLQLVACRFIQGLGCSALYTASAAIVSQAFAPGERGKALGWLFAGNGLGLAIGPVAGGLLVSSLGWRWIFLINLPLLALSLLLCLRHVHESFEPGEGEAMDWKGLAVTLLALPCALLAISSAGAWGWLSWRSATAFAAALLLLGIVLAVEARAASPLINLKLLRQPSFAIAGMASAAPAFFYCGAFFLVPLYLSQERALDSHAIGWMLMPTTAVMALSSPWLGRMADRFGPQRVMLAGFACLAASAVLQAPFDLHTSWVDVVLAFALFGVGWACILGPSTAAALSAAPSAAVGAATGTAWTLHNFGGAIGLTLVTAVFQHFAGADGVRFMSGYRPAMWLLGGVCLVALAMLAVGPRPVRLASP